MQMPQIKLFEKKPKEIKRNDYTNAWVTVVSTTIFFISFFSSYFVALNSLDIAFIRSMVVLVVSNILLRIIVILWHFTIPREQWLLVVQGPPEVDSRTTRIIKERERLAAEEEAAAALATEATDDETNMEDLGWE